MDIMYINEIPIVMRMLRGINFCTSELIKKKRQPTLWHLSDKLFRHKMDVDWM